MATPSPNPTTSTNLTCPRCAYDLSGPIPTWTTACPTTGTCPECGLDYHWSEIFNRLRDLPPWFFEFATRRRLISLLSTTARSVLPWHFWCAVRLSYPLQPRRLAAVVLLLPLLLYLAGAVAIFAVELFLQLFSWGPTPVPTVSITASLTHPFMLTRILGWPAANPGRGFFLVWLVPSLIMPGGFVLLTETLGRAKVRLVHLLRATVYTIAPIPLLCFAESMILLILYMESQSDPFGWHTRNSTGSTTWGLAPTLAGQLIESALWEPQFWPMFWPTWMLVAWWCVCRFYLRIRHAFLTAFLLLLLAFLVVPAGFAAVDLLMRIAS